MHSLPVWVVAAHSGSRGKGIFKFKASLVYSMSSRTARATQRNPVSKKPGLRAFQKNKNIG